MTLIQVNPEGDDMAKDFADAIRLRSPRHQRSNAVVGKVNRVTENDILIVTHSYEDGELTISQHWKHQKK